MSEQKKYGVTNPFNLEGWDNQNFKPLEMKITECTEIAQQAEMAIYVTSSGTFENDIWCVVVCGTGDIVHVRTDQIKMHKNKTFDI